MQSLEIISVNIWTILISLCNLVILFLVLKKFLYKPVTRVLQKRQEALDQQYGDAQNALNEANALKDSWQQKMDTANGTAEAILQTAKENAERRKAAIMEETTQKADLILRRAQADAELEKEKAQADIKKEIVDVSAAISEKLLAREINPDDHKNLIDDFIDGLKTGENQ